MDVVGIQIACHAFGMAPSGDIPHRRELKTKALVKLLYETLRFD